MSRNTMNLKELHEAVSQWGIDRNFFGEGGSTYEGQWCKLFEEAGELATGINKKKDKVVKDSVGDMLVVCIMLEHLARKQHSLTITAGFNLFSCVGEYREQPLHNHLYMITGELSWLSSANTATTYKGVYLQRMVAHLANVASAYNYNLAECLEAAYEEIKDRKGQMVNGVFIKEDDL